MRFGIRHLACRLRASVAGYLLLTLFPFSGWAGEVGEIVVNAVALPRMQLEQTFAEFAAQGVQDSPENRRRVLEELATREVVAQEAARLGLDKQSEYQAALANARRNLLVKAWQIEFASKYAPIEEDLRKLYEKQKTDAGPVEYRVRHVLVKTEEEVKALQAELENGRKFDQLARAKSIDSASRAKGGDIGWMLPGSLVSSVREVVQTLTTGQVSSPVQSQFGWHLVRVDETRPYTFPEYDAVRTSLVQHLRNQASQQAIAELRRRAKVDYQTGDGVNAP